jgi:hypothetical protein
MAIGLLQGASWGWFVLEAFGGLARAKQTHGCLIPIGSGTEGHWPLEMLMGLV